CDQVKIITTNDNLLALKFYQKRGYCLAELLKDAVKEARKIKPEIPFLGNDGIPIRDEVVLVKNLSTTK
ncbi:GNAT family N-acetyltransferase, partial [Streptococcus hyovaginalis]